MFKVKVRSIYSFVTTEKSILRSVASTAVEQTQNLKPWKDIPGPKTLPFIGPILSFLPGGEIAGYKGVKLSERVYKLYGPIVRFDGIFGGQDMVLLFDPETVGHVLRSEEPMPIRPGLQSMEYYRTRHNKVYDEKRSTGLISDHGANWRDFRSKVNPIMMQPKTIKLYTEVLAEVANDMVSRLRSIRDENNQIKKRLHVELNLWALESIGVVALGTRLNCFDPTLPADSPVRKLIQNVHDIFNISEKLDFGISPWRLYATSTFKKAMKIYEEHERLTKYFIDQAMKNLEKMTESSVENSYSEKPVLEKLLDIDVRVAHVMASDMLLGGVDTAANTAIATLYLLAINSEKQNKLREEILSKQSRKPYLRACMKEAMRLLPVVNGSVRLSTREYNLHGYKIPKDVLIAFSHHYMCLMPENYPKPDEFIPERWLAEKDDPLYYGNTHPFVMAPFGFGVRSCIGPWGPSAHKLFTEIAKLLVDVSGDRRAGGFLAQRISIAIQRGNAASILGAMPQGPVLDLSRRIAELEIETLISKVMENFQIEWPSKEPLNIAPTSLNYVTEPFYFVFKDL